MQLQPTCQRLPLHALLGAALLTLTGCLSFTNPVQPPEPEVLQPCKELPRYCRSHVYIFLIGGLDPFCAANMDGLNDYLHKLGFGKTYCGQLYYGYCFDKDIRKIHEEDHEARFVLIGFSFGANAVRAIANTVQKDDITIDLLVYLGGNTIMNEPRSRPDNVLHIVSVLATGWIWNGDHIDGADHYSVPDTWHFGSPCHPTTLRVLAKELQEVANRVSVPYPAVEPTPEDELAPTPRPVTPQPDAEARQDEWDFLKPVNTLAPSEVSPAPSASASPLPIHVGPQSIEEPFRPAGVNWTVAPGELSHHVARPQ